MGTLLCLNVFLPLTLCRVKKPPLEFDLILRVFLSFAKLLLEIFTAREWPNRRNVAQNKFLKQMN